MNLKNIYLTLVLFVLILTACQAQASPAYETVAPATIKPGDSIPAPTGEAILTLSGGIEVKNNGDTLVLEMATLEKLGLVEYAVTDPWRNAKVIYTGVLMSDLLKAIGASPSATKVHMVALDDYEVDITLADIQKWPVLLATRADGAPISIENGGPTRLIFPYDSYEEIDQIAYKDLWIWNITSMEIQ